MIKDVTLAAPQYRPMIWIFLFCWCLEEKNCYKLLNCVMKWYALAQQESVLVSCPSSSLTQSCLGIRIRVTWSSFKDIPKLCLVLLISRFVASKLGLVWFATFGCIAPFPAEQPTHPVFLSNLQASRKILLASSSITNFVFLGCCNGFRKYCFKSAYCLWRDHCLSDRHRFKDFRRLQGARSPNFCIRVREVYANCKRDRDTVVHDRVLTCRGASSRCAVWSWHILPVSLHEKDEGVSKTRKAFQF